MLGSLFEMSLGQKVIGYIPLEKKFISLSLVKMAEVICPKHYSIQVKCIPLLTNTVGKQIVKILEAFKEQVLEETIPHRKLVT